MLGNPVELSLVPLTVATVGIRFPPIDVTEELKKRFEESLASRTIEVNAGLSLGRDFLFLRARDTTPLTIEGLGSALGSILGAVRESLPIKCLTRVGARYVNEFTHPENRGGLAAWKELLNPSLFALCGDLGVPKTWSHSVHADYGDGELLLRHGTFEGYPEQYFLDSDVFSLSPMSLQVDEVVQVLRYFQNRLYQVFRWSLQTHYFEYLRTGDLNQLLR